MNTSKLKIGLVGAGRMGRFHLEKLKLHPEVEISGVFDKNPNLKENLNLSEIRAFSSLEELVFESDALVIASPTSTHYAIARLALENGLHIFVEKPICDKTVYASDLVRLAKEKNRVIQTGFVERYRWLELEKMLNQDFLVKPSLLAAERIACEPSREPDLDVVMDLMIHDVDLVLWALKEPPISIVAEGISFGLRTIDLAYARLEFPSGAIAHLKAQWGSPFKRRETHLAWTDRTLSHDLLNGKAFVFEGSSKELTPPSFDALSRQLNGFVRAIQGKEDVIVTGTDGLRALEICDEIRGKISEKKLDKPRISPREKKFLSMFWEEYVN